MIRVETDDEAVASSGFGAKEGACVRMNDGMKEGHDALSAPSADGESVSSVVTAAKSFCALAVDDSGLGKRVERT